MTSAVSTCSRFISPFASVMSSVVAAWHLLPLPYVSSAGSSQGPCSKSCGAIDGAYTPSMVLSSIAVAMLSPLLSSVAALIDGSSFPEFSAGTVVSGMCWCCCDGLSFS